MRLAETFFFFFYRRERVGFVCVEICCSYSTRWFVFLYLSEISFLFLNDCEGFLVTYKFQLWKRRLGIRFRNGSSLLLVSVWRGQRP